MLTLQFGINEGDDKIVFVTKCYQNKHDNKRYRFRNSKKTKLNVYILLTKYRITCMKVDHILSKNDSTVHK